MYCLSTCHENIVEENAKKNTVYHTYRYIKGPKAKFVTVISVN